jgi:hypothetical protein
MASVFGMNTIIHAGTNDDAGLVVGASIAAMIREWHS